MDYNRMSETELTNRWALIGWAIVALCLSIAYGTKGFERQQKAM